MGDDEKQQILEHYPNSIGAQVVRNWKSDWQDRLEFVSQLVKNRVSGNSEPCTVVHVRLGDVFGGEEWYARAKQPIDVNTLVKVCPPVLPVQVIGKKHFCVTHATLDLESVDKSDKYLTSVLNALHATHYDGGDADSDLCKAVSALQFVAGKGHMSALIIAIRRHLGKKSIIPHQSTCGCPESFWRLCFEWRKNYAVLFTMYNEEKRDAMTLDVLQHYRCLFSRDRLFVVDSANRGTDQLPESQQAVFDQETIRSFVNTPHLATIGELISLVYAFNKLDFGHFTHVIKITTKYKIYNLYDIRIDPDSELILQHTGRPGFQNTEVLGFRVDKAQSILADLGGFSDNPMMEERVSRITDKYVAQKLPQLNLVPPLYPRSWGDTLINL